MKAIALFEDILKEEPRSARAHYALTRSMQYMNVSSFNEDSIKDYQVKIIQRFRDLYTRSEEEVLKPVYNTAVMQVSKVTV